MCSAEPAPSPALAGTLRAALLRVARGAIAYGLQHGHPPPLDPGRFDRSLSEHRATFVTLQAHGELRGCIGALEPHRTLVEDVNHNAFAAAFQDPRFRPLGPGELDRVRIEISVLSPPEPVAAESEEDLLARLRPGVDGLILEEAGRRATFLPSVWESLPGPRRFLRQLKRKAGLAPDYWSRSLAVWRYTTESFGEPEG